MFNSLETSLEANSNISEMFFERIVGKSLIFGKGHIEEMFQ